MSLQELPAPKAQRNGSKWAANTRQDCSGVTGHLLELGPVTGNMAVVAAACVSQRKRFIANSPWEVEVRHPRHCICRDRRYV